LIIIFIIMSYFFGRSWVYISDFYFIIHYNILISVNLTLRDNNYWSDINLLYEVVVTWFFICFMDIGYCVTMCEKKIFHIIFIISYLVRCFPFIIIRQQCLRNITADKTIVWVHIGEHCCFHSTVLEQSLTLLCSNRLSARAVAKNTFGKVFLLF